MKKIASNGKFEIFSSFGNAVIEGSLPSRDQGEGEFISFRVEEIDPVYSYLFSRIEPINGGASDFWENFSTNLLAGEPATEFDLIGPVHYLNADSFVEGDEEFFFSVYESHPAFGYEPLIRAKFTIIDDDGSVDPTVVKVSSLELIENSRGAEVGVLSLEGLGAKVDHKFIVEDERFEVVDAKLKLKPDVALDFEEGSIAAVDVSVVGSGFALTQRFDLAVSDVNEVATAVRLSSATVKENAAGATIGQLTVTDPDARDSHSFTVSDDRFEVVGGSLKLKSGVALDHEAGATVPVEVTAKDAAGLSLTQRFDVAVSNVNEAATAVRLSSATVKENTAGATIGQLTVTDPDADETHSFTVSDARFEVVDGALKLKAGFGLDYEAEATVPIEVTVIEAGVPGLIQGFTIDVQNVVENVLPPVDEEETGDDPDNTPKGTKGNDVLVGTSGRDKLVGRKGDDIIAGGKGADTLSGGKGFDTLDYSGSAKGVTVNLQKGVGKGGEAQGDKLSGFEGVIGSDANDKLLGSKGGNVLIGGQGADVLNGRGGKDWADYSASEGGVTVNLAKRSGSGGDADGDRLINIERVQGSAQNDKLTGDNGKNVLVGDAGKDKLVGGRGRDELDGGIGRDKLFGGKGNDKLNGGNSNDKLVGGGGRDDLDGGAGRDKLLGGAGKDTLSGGEGNDRLVGGGGKDRLDGGAGNDTVLGGGGADTFVFDLGSDKLVGGKGRDTVEFDGAFDDYDVTFGKRVIVIFEDDRDVLIGMERLEFDDIVYTRQNGEWVELA